MSDKLPPPVGKDRPFPWHCFECNAKEVYRQATDYTSTCNFDGQLYTIRIPDLEIPTCRRCGAQVFAVGDDDRIIAALRAQLGLLTPHDILKHRNNLGLSQRELAEQLGVTVETVDSWETCGTMQSRAMDNLLRVYFESNEARDILDRHLATATPVAADRTA